MANNSDKTFRDLLNSGQAHILGIVSMVPMGNWNATTTYQKLNYVRHNGATYLAKTSSTNVEPGIAQNWQDAWMLCNYDGGSVNPQGTYPDMTVGKVVNALFFGSKSYDGSAQQTITAADLGLADVYKPQGSIAFSALPATPSADTYGYVWNITNDFTTDSRFIEGAGKQYSAGTNVGVIENSGSYYYDILGAIVDLSNYVTKTQVATSSSLGLIQLGYQENEKNYPVELDSNNRAYVNVPWEGTNYSAGTGLELSEQGVFSLETPVSVANGGTGKTSLANVTVGNAETADKVANALTMQNAYYSENNGQNYISGSFAYDGSAARIIDLAPQTTNVYAEITAANMFAYVYANIIMQRRGYKADIHMDFRIDLRGGNPISDWTLFTAARLADVLGLSSLSFEQKNTRVIIENCPSNIFGTVGGNYAGYTGFVLNLDFSYSGGICIGRFYNQPSNDGVGGWEVTTEEVYSEDYIYHADIWGADVT